MKFVITKILLFVLGRGFQTIAKIDLEVAKEIYTWDENPLPYCLKYCQMAHI